MAESLKQREILYKKKYFLELWERSKTGDKDAFRQLAKAHYSTLFRYAYNITKDKEIVKDTIQDLFAHLWERRQTINMQAVTIYLIKSLRNQLYNKFRKTEYSIIKVDLEEAEEIQDDYMIESVLIQSEMDTEKEQRIYGAVMTLPKRQREAVFLKYYQRLDNEKIAEIMEVNHQSVSNFLHKAISTLRIYLTNEAPVVLSLTLAGIFNILCV